MNIGDLIKGDFIISELAATGKKEALEELCRFLKDKGEIHDSQLLYDSLWDREKLGSTGIGDQVAVPHAKTDEISAMVVLFARSTRGVDFESLDQKPVHFICLLLAPPESTSQHMKALARIARLFKDGELRDRILGAPDAAAIHAILLEEDSKYN